MRASNRRTGYNSRCLVSTSSLFQSESVGHARPSVQESQVAPEVGVRYAFYVRALALPDFSRREHRKVVKMSDFWVKKMRTYFKRIDFDKDGAITKKDFEGMADRFVTSEKLDHARGEELKKKLVEVWEQYLKGVVTDGTKLTEDVFVNAVKPKVHDKELKKTLAGPLPIFFRAVDANGDGFIQEDEYALFFQILGLDPKLASTSFKAIDTNNDGQLSLDEFVVAGTDFFTSEDEHSPSQLFWGPLL